MAPHNGASGRGRQVDPLRPGFRQSDDGRGGSDDRISRYAQSPRQVSPPRWLALEEVLVVHERQLGRFGGAPGIRDRGALESALSRPVNRWAYEKAGIVELAGAYAF